MNEFSCPIPILSVKSVPESIDYYIEKLGFKKDWDWGSPPTFASVSRGRSAIFLCHNAQGHAGTWMSIFVTDVDLLHEEFKSSGAFIRQTPTNFPWGTREMNVQDLDGHRIRFGSRSTGHPDGTALAED